MHLPPPAPSQRSGSINALDLLLHRISSGDRAALAAFYDRTAAMVFAAMVDVLGDHPRAEHVTQELYLRIWTTRGRWDRAAGSAVVWLLDAARSAASARARADHDYDPVREALHILASDARPGS